MQKLKYRGGSWAGYPVFLFLCFSRSFSVFVVSFCFVFCFRLVDLSFCIYNRTNTYINQKTKNIKKLREKQNNWKRTTEIHYFAAGTWERFIRGRVEGWISCILVFRVFRVFLEALFVFCVFMFFMFSPSLFKLLHLQSNKHI